MKSMVLGNIEAVPLSEPIVVAVMVSPVEACRIVPEELPDSVNVIVPVNVPVGPSVRVIGIVDGSVVSDFTFTMIEVLEPESVTVMVAVSLSLY